MPKKKNTTNELKFYQKLILNRYLLRSFGIEKFEDLANILKTPKLEEIYVDGSTGFYEEIIKYYRDNMEISEDEIQQYDLNIVSHLNKINYKRKEKIKLKYFQYLSLLFVERYLDLFFNQREKLLNDLNECLNTFGEEYDEVKNIPQYKDSDLNKIALWNATGSGKTILMHINYYQYICYAGKISENDTYILLTPKEGLSKQHLSEYSESNIPAEIYDKNASRGLVLNKEAIQILENTKLAKKDGDKTIAASRFGTSNVVFVDEGHRGASGDTWYKFRNELCKNGFSFEYSATFGQAIIASNDKDLEAEYEKCIIFDYSYKYFYNDGYGKDYNILNLQDDSNIDKSTIYLTACLLTYYQQKVLYIDKYNLYKEYNIENPLMIFVGSSVNAIRESKGTKTSDVVDILLFFNKFIKERETSISNIKRILDHDTGILDALNRDVFRNCFSYLTSLTITPEEIFTDILKKVFNCNTNSSILHIENIKGIQGEISLRLGENDSFGVINVGDDSDLLKLCKASGFETGNIDFKESLFEKITSNDSKINILIGSKKFTEGWNCWRVSTMGLMNVGKSEGSEIIQLFGRGVRLKGFDFSLMRSLQYVKCHREKRLAPPQYIDILETLNVFGVKSDYMSKFKEYLEHEGVPTSKDMPHIIKMPIIRNKKYKKKNLYALQIKDGIDYKKDAGRLMFQYCSGLSIDLDCYGKVQFESSQNRIGSEQSKNSEKLKKEHFAMIDIDKLYFSLEKYKAEKQRNNLIITREKIQDLLNHDDWYQLLIPQQELVINNYEDYKKIEKIVIVLLKLYCDKLYNTSRQNWESNYMEYKIVDDDFENFIENDEYLVAINDVPENLELVNFVEELKKELVNAKKKKQLIDYSDPRKKGNFELFSFDNSLYNPLLSVKRGEKEIVVSPVSLVESEKNFILDLDKYLKNNKDDFKNKEVYLIRNKAKKGIGFFENVGFYPDFIMWLIKEDKQYITFIEPHGLVHETLNGEKIQLHKRIKTIQSDLNNNNVILNSIIVSDSMIRNLLDNHFEEEWNENNVFFMNDSSYIEKIFNIMK